MIEQRSGNQLEWFIAGSLSQPIPDEHVLARSTPQPPQDRSWPTLVQAVAAVDFFPAPRWVKPAVDTASTILCCHAPFVVLGSLAGARSRAGGTTFSL